MVNSHSSRFEMAPIKIVCLHSMKVHSPVVLSYPILTQCRWYTRYKTSYNKRC